MLYIEFERKNRKYELVGSEAFLSSPSAVGIMLLFCFIIAIFLTSDTFGMKYNNTNMNCNGNSFFNLPFAYTITYYMQYRIYRPIFEAL